MSKVHRLDGLEVQEVENTELEPMQEPDAVLEMAAASTLRQVPALNMPTTGQRPVLHFFLTSLVLFKFRFRLYIHP